jgi:hypothetical protein
MPCYIPYSDNLLFALRPILFSNNKKAVQYQLKDGYR